MENATNIAGQRGYADNLPPQILQGSTNGPREFERINAHISSCMSTAESISKSLGTLTGRVFGEVPMAQEEAKCREVRSGDAGQALDALQTLFEELAALASLANRINERL